MPSGRGSGSHEGRWFGFALALVALVIGLAAWQNGWLGERGLHAVTVGVRPERPQSQSQPRHTGASAESERRELGHRTRRRPPSQRPPGPGLDTADEGVDPPVRRGHGDPEDAMDAGELLRAATDAYARGEMTIAYRRAAKSFGKNRSIDALELKAKAACGLEQRGVARSALAQLPVVRRRNVREACRAAGVRLGG